MTVSALDNVAGLGEVRRKALIRHFGSVAALRRADVEEISRCPGSGARTAEAVVDALAGRPGATGAARPRPRRPAVDGAGRADPPCTERRPPNRYRRPARTERPCPVTDTGAADGRGAEMAR